MSESLILEQIEELCQQAQDAQNSGELATAKQLWEAVLSMAPESEKAQEGLRVCSMAETQWSAFDDAAAGATQPVDDAVRRIEALLCQGDVEEAQRQAAALLVEHPEAAPVVEVHRKVEEAGRALAGKQAALAESRAAFEQGRLEAAREICRTVLEKEPGDREAELLLEDIERQSDSDADAPETPDAAGFDLDLDLGEPALDAQPKRTSHLDTQETPIAGAGPDGDLELDPEFLPSQPSIPMPPPVAPSPDSSTSMRDLVEAAADLEEDEPVETFVPPPEPAFEPEPPKEPTGPAAEFLAHARQALDAGDAHRAIDMAARALAADESTPGAQDLLDQAHRLSKEKEAKAENLLSTAIFDFDQGRIAQAEPALRQVLELVPDHPEAIDYLEKVERQKAEEAAAAAATTSGEAEGENDIFAGGGEDLGSIPLDMSQMPSATSPAAQDAATGEMTTGALGQPSPPPPPPPVVDLSATGAVPPTAPTASSAMSSGRANLGRKKAKPAAVRSGRRSSGLLVSVLLIVGLAAAGWYGYQTWFGGGETSSPQPPVAAAPAPPQTQESAAKSEKKRSAASEGNTETKQVKKTASERRYDKSEVPGLRRRAQRALAEGDPKTAVELLFAAQAADPSDFDVLDELESARKVLEAREVADEKIRVAKAAFAEGAYDEAMRIFYRLPEGHHPERLSRWIGNGWYNLGVQALQAGAVEEAVRFFKNTLEVQKDDTDAARHLKVAARYRRRGLDKAYRLYTQNLHLRTLDD